jgi:hypothetical protein
MRHIQYILLAIMIFGCVPSNEPGNSNSNNGNTNSNPVGNGGNGLGAGQPTNSCGAILEGASQGGGGNSSGASGGGTSSANPNIAIALILPGGSTTYIPLCTYGLLDSEIPASTTDIPFPASNDTLFIWEDGSHLADYVSPATNGLRRFSGDVFQFLTDSVAGTNSSGTGQTYYLVRNLAGGDSVTTADTANFLAPAQANLCLNMDLSGNNFNRFSGNQVGYIAFRIATLPADGGGYTYGWIKVSVDNSFYLTVYEIGFNTVLNQPILMGETQ